MELFLQLIVTGVMLGSIFALVALGWVLIYKCSGVLNLAMGELTMIGGYVCLAFYQRFVTIMPINYAFILALIGTIFVGLILGLLTERIFLRKMIGQPILAVIMVTVGLSFFFKGMVFMIWDTDTQVFLPRVFSIEPIVVGGIAVGAVYLWSFIAAMILMVVFICFFKYTRWGLSMQACADDEMAALSLGVSAKFVYALAWAIAFMAAGVGGTLLANINGLNYSVSSLGLLVLPVVVLGGLNSVPGAIVGGITIGILQNLAGGYGEAFIPGSKEVAPFVFMVIFLLFKPYGLWGWERIERV
ncbi:MAG: branched-chain amino acid ABC transporter permease [Desulfomonilaceae bacterium]|jgi:branched-chain amino acid transport system permease protein|nr:branched-chain amino acid ABC transporter permease [Syntrophaceae bacterium]